MGGPPSRRPLCRSLAARRLHSFFSFCLSVTVYNTDTATNDPYLYSLRRLSLHDPSARRAALCKARLAGGGGCRAARAAGAIGTKRTREMPRGHADLPQHTRAHGMPWCVPPFLSASPPPLSVCRRPSGPTPAHRVSLYSLPPPSVSWRLGSNRQGPRIHDDGLTHTAVLPFPRRCAPALPSSVWAVARGSPARAAAGGAVRLRRGV